jgi:hypothetical protein
MAMPEGEGWDALQGGDQRAAVDAAQRLLADADAGRGRWQPDDLRHRAHALLGFIHLINGDLDAAESELVLSADVGDTAVLGSFGPDLGLVWELLRLGRAEAAVRFAQQFGRFWRGPSLRRTEGTP